MKKVLALLLASVMLLSMMSAMALAEDAPAVPEGATFEFVDAEAIGVEGSGIYVYIASELYSPEPMLMPIILIYADKGYQDADAAWKVMCDNGLLDIAEAEHAAVMMINPVGDTWGEKDHDVFRSIVTKVCAAKNGSTIFGFYTYCTMISAIGEGSGATFINQYLTQDCNRLAAVATFGGTMSSNVRPYTALPAYISSGNRNAISYYRSANETDTQETKENGLTEYYKAAFPTQRVVVDSDGPASFDKDAIADAWYYVLRRTTRNALGDPLWQYPNTYDILPLMPRPMINELDLTMLLQGDKDENGKIIQSTRWYEWIPNEVFDTMANEDDDTVYPLVMCYHGSGDHPIFEAESNGWVQLAGEERFILVSPETNNNAARNMTLIQNIIEKYPVDVTRIYATGFSMGGGSTNTMIASYPDFLAAAAPSAMNSAIRVSDEVIANVDLPIYETACSQDLYFTRNGNNYTFAGVNAKLKLNNFDIQLGSSNPDYEEYPFYGFDIDKVAETETLYSAHGIPFNVTTFKNEAGVPLVKFRVAMGMNHNHYTEFGRDIWEFFKCFSRDPETKAVVYNPPEAIEAETVWADARTSDTADVTIKYTGDVDISSVRFLVDCDLPLAAEGADAVYTTDYEAEANASGKVVVYSTEGLKAGDIITLTFDIAGAADGKYPVKLTVLDATDLNIEDIEISTTAGAIIIDNTYPKGDVTMDGEITNADVIMIARYLVDLEKFNSKQKDLADYNDDGIIDNKDLILIAKVVAAA